MFAKVGVEGLFSRPRFRELKFDIDDIDDMVQHVIVPIAPLTNR
jgi:hypothetical protein